MIILHQTVFVPGHVPYLGTIGGLSFHPWWSDCTTRAEELRWRQDEPQAQPAGIETTKSRFAGGLHLPSGARSRLASSLRPC